MSSVRKNYFYKTLYDVLAIVIPLISAPYVTRVLGAEQLGIYTYAFSVVLIFMKVAALGIYNHGSRSIAKYQKDPDNRNKTFFEIYTVQIVSCAIVFFAYLFYVLFLVKDDKIIAAIQILYFVSSFFDISWFFTGIEEIKKTVLKDTAVKIASLILIFVLVKSRNDLYKYAIIVLGSNLLGILLLWLGAKKYIKWVRPRRSNVKQQIKPILVLFIPTVAVLIYTMMDKLMLGQMSGDAELAFYQYAANIVSIPLNFITSYGIVMCPRMSAVFAGPIVDDKAKFTITNSLSFVTFMACAFTFGLSCISDDLIPLYYGDEFLPCIVLLILISAKLPFMAWSDVIRTQVLIPQHKDNLYIISLFCGAFANLAINLLLIPPYGAVGAAIGTIAAEAIVAITQAIIARKEFYVWKAVKSEAVYLTIGAIMCLSVRVVHSWLISLKPLVLLVFEILIGAAVYLLLSAVYLCFSKKQTPAKMIKSLLGLANKNNNDILNIE